MAKFAEDDRIEQMNGQRRRLKQLEHKKAVDNLLEQRRRQLALNRVCYPLSYSNNGLQICFYLAT